MNTDDANNIVPKKIITTIAITLGSELAVCLLLWLGMKLAGIDPMGNIRWFASMFIPPCLILRHFAKKKEDTAATKSIIITLFVTFIVFVFILKKTGIF